LKSPPQRKRFQIRMGKESTRFVWRGEKKKRKEESRERGEALAGTGGKIRGNRKIVSPCLKEL